MFFSPITLIVVVSSIVFQSEANVRLICVTGVVRINILRQKAVEAC